MNPRLRRIVDGFSSSEENIWAGDNELVGGDRDRGWMRSHPGTPSSTRGPIRIGG
jgi:hypothetical protein